MSRASLRQSRTHLIRADFSRPRLCALLVVIAAALLGAAPVAAAHGHKHKHKHHARASGPCAGENVPASQGSFTVLRGAVLCLINDQRARHHLPRLHQSARLNRSAQGWTNTMISFDEFTHGSDFAARISATGFNWSQAGENIATGFSTPREVVAAWMRSTDHCQNILDPSYRDVGTGVDARPVRGWASRPATWTQDFALPMGQSPPSHNWGPADHCPYN